MLIGKPTPTSHTSASYSQQRSKHINQNDPLDHPRIVVKPLTRQTPRQSSTIAWRISSTPSTKLDIEIKESTGQTGGSFTSP